MTATKRILATALLPLMLLIAGCPGVPRYSDDPAAARIQRLEDFCIGYGALRDGATYMLTIDAVRTTPVLSVELVEGYASARAFIQPFCSPTFNPASTDFNLEDLQRELFKIRLILLEKENA